MKVEILKQVFSKENMNVIKATFFEEGYEIRVKLKPTTQDLEEVEKYERIRENFKKLDELNYNGLAVFDTSIVGDEYSIILVPVSMNEMTDFIWNYVENFGEGEEVSPKLLSEAFAALENTVDAIPSELKSCKSEARANYERFTSMIF